jgi:hypothetical protein
LADATSDAITSNPPAPDTQIAVATPKLFRFNNHTDGTAYIDRDKPVAGHRTVDGELGGCNYFALGCMVRCAEYQPGASCCVQCERPQPTLIPIPPYETRTVPWTGNLYSRVDGYCADCACEGVTPAKPGTYWATTQVFAAYECEFPGCTTTADGSIVNARALGSPWEHVRSFEVPSPESEIVIDIDYLPPMDAGIGPDLAPVDLAPPDLAPADLVIAGECSPDALPSPFADLPGHTYQIAASNTAPDASARSWKSPCTPHDVNATYDLIFSADGTCVHIVRTDPVQEETMDGVLGEASGSQLVYAIDNHWAGAELVVRVDNGSFVAQLAVFGSGLPVVDCIESAMLAR